MGMGLWFVGAAGGVYCGWGGALRGGDAIGEKIDMKKKSTAVVEKGSQWQPLMSNVGIRNVEFLEFGMSIVGICSIKCWNVG